jgi:hypothetical protein
MFGTADRQVDAWSPYNTCVMRRMIGHTECERKTRECPLRDDAVKTKSLCMNNPEKHMPKGYRFQKTQSTCGLETTPK